MVQRESAGTPPWGAETSGPGPSSAAGFTASASRTVAADVHDVFGAWIDEPRRREWLRNDQLVISESRPGVSLHGAWGTTRVRVFFLPRGAARTAVTVDQEPLPTARKAEQMRKFWQARLGRLAAMLESLRP